MAIRTLAAVAGQPVRAATVRGVRTDHGVTTEAELQDQITELATICGWSWNHTHPLRTKHGWRTPTSWEGWPDLVLWRPPDGFLVLEVKGDGGKPGPGQVDTIASMGACTGVRARMVWPSDWPWIQAQLVARPGHPPG